jgi:hypothetical protein
MSKCDSTRRRGTNAFKVLAAILLIAAIAKELRLPKEERTWHGSLCGFVPYDFRKPTLDKIKTTFWEPEGTVIVNRVFGVGWTLNFGAVVAKVRAARA